MSRGRKFKTMRRTAVSERSLFEQKLSGGYSRTLDRVELLNLIRGGEDTYLEFKIRLVNADKVAAGIVALANAGGGAIVFGVNDHRRLEGLDDPEQVEEQLIDICRNQIKPPILPRIDKVSFDNAARILVLQVDDRRAPHRTADDRYFIRIGSTKREADPDEIAALFAQSRAASLEDMPVLKAGIEDIDEALVWSYVRDLEGEAFREPAGFPTAAVMRDLRLAVAYGSDIVPTLAGFLLFGRSAAFEKAVPQSQLVLTRFSGMDLSAPVVERAELFGNLTSLFDRSLSFIKLYADLWETRPSRSAAQSLISPQTPVRARANYSRDVVMEALTNLLVHRDYSTAGSPSRVLVFDDRLEFINASRNRELTRRSVEYGVTSRPHPRLHHAFTSAEYGIEPARRGIPALRRAHHAFTRREARISMLNDEFRLELSGI